MGFGSVREVAWAFPFRANIADGLALERLNQQRVEESNTNRGVGTVYRAIDNELLHQSRAAIRLF